MEPFKTLLGLIGLNWKDISRKSKTTTDLYAYSIYDQSNATYDTLELLESCVL